VASELTNRVESSSRIFLCGASRPLTLGVVNSLPTSGPPTDSIGGNCEEELDNLQSEYLSLMKSLFLGFWCCSSRVQVAWLGLDIASIKTA
jgi:hypothetical protein